jgi:hypothetical protein
MTDGELAAAVTKLLAIEEIRKLKARYFRYLDDGDWEALTALYMPDAVMDISEVLPAGTPEHLLLVHGADTIVGQTRDLLQGATMVHNGYTHEIDILSDDEATSIWSQEDRAIFPEGVPCPFPFRESHNFGRYYTRYIRVDGAWRIASLKLTRQLIRTK